MRTRWLELLTIAWTHAGRVSLLLLALSFATGCRSPSPAQAEVALPPQFQELVQLSCDGASLFDAPIPVALYTDQASIDVVLRYLSANPDYSSYHLLFYVRAVARPRYDDLSPELRARILWSAMRHVGDYNDFGGLKPDRSYDGIAGVALRDTGRASIPYLRDLLDDTAVADCTGGEIATMARLFCYRRCDYAYRYLMAALGRQPEFLASYRDRDVLIKSLRRELRGR